MAANSTNISWASQRWPKACDQCCYRKTKCDRTNPCPRCVEKGFTCTYNRILQTKGPKGKRVNEIRRRQLGMSSRAAENAAEELVSIQVQEEERANFDSVDTDWIEFGMATPEAEESPFQLAASPDVMNHDVDRGSVPDSGISWTLQEMMSDTYDKEWPQDREAMPLLAMQTASFWSSPPIEPSSTEFVVSPATSQAALVHSYQVSRAPTTFWPRGIKESEILPLVEMFLSRLHAVTPVFPRTYLHNCMVAQEHHTNPNFGAMLLALCAFVLIQPILVDERGAIGSRTVRARFYMDEAVKLRDSSLGQDPSLESVLTSFFLFASLFGTGQDNAAWFRLKEAMVLAELLDLGKPSKYHNIDSEERERRVRTYWVLAITERAYALQRRHPLHFQSNPNLSLEASTSARSIGSNRADLLDARDLQGLEKLFGIFRGIDKAIIDCSNECCESGSFDCGKITQSKILEFYVAQAKLPIRNSCRTNAVSLARVHCQPDDNSASQAAMQEVDILVTQQWLFSRLWRLSLKHELLMVNHKHSELRFDSIITIARNVLQVCTQATLDSMEVHGVGFLEKLNDIAMSVVCYHRQDPGDLNITGLPSTDEASTVIDPQLTHSALNNGVGEYDAPVRYNPPSKAAVTEILNHFLAIFALFRGGHNPYLHPFMQVISQLNS